MGIHPPQYCVHTKYIKRCLPWCTRQSCASLDYDTDNCLAVPPTQVLVATAVWHQSLYSAITLKLQLQLSIMSLWLLPCVMPQHVDQGLEAHYWSRAALSSWPGPKNFSGIYGDCVRHFGYAVFRGLQPGPSVTTVLTLIMVTQSRLLAVSRSQSRCQMLCPLPWSMLHCQWVSRPAPLPT